MWSFHLHISDVSAWALLFTSCWPFDPLPQELPRLLLLQPPAPFVSALLCRPEIPNFDGVQSSRVWPHGLHLFGLGWEGFSNTASQSET